PGPPRARPPPPPPPPPPPRPPPPPAAGLQIRGLLPAGGNEAAGEVRHRDRGGWAANPAAGRAVVLRRAGDRVPGRRAPEAHDSGRRLRGLHVILRVLPQAGIGADRTGAGIPAEAEGGAAGGQRDADPEPKPDRGGVGAENRVGGHADGFNPRRCFHGTAELSGAVLIRMAANVRLRTVQRLCGLYEHRAGCQRTAGDRNLDKLHAAVLRTGFHRILEAVAHQPVGVAAGLHLLPDNTGLAESIPQPEERPQPDRPADGDDAGERAVAWSVVAHAGVGRSARAVPGGRTCGHAGATSGAAGRAAVVATGVGDDDRVRISGGGMGTVQDGDGSGDPIREGHRGAQFLGGPGVHAGMAGPVHEEALLAVAGTWAA
ncbi:MAG: hypothetical protein PVF83_14505, partial [Anaerolineales bacterium]